MLLVIPRRVAVVGLGNIGEDIAGFLDPGGFVVQLAVGFDVLGQVGPVRAGDEIVQQDVDVIPSRRSSCSLQITS